MSRSLPPKTAHESQMEIVLLLLAGALVVMWPSLLLGLICWTVLFLLPRWYTNLSPRWIRGGLWAAAALGGAGLVVTLQALSWNLAEILTGALGGLLTLQWGQALAFLIPLWTITLWLAPCHALVFHLLASRRSAGSQLLGEATQRERQHDRERARATSLLASAPDEIEGEVVIGVALRGYGDLPWVRENGWFVCPGAYFGQPMFVIGESGSGKTETMMKLAYGARKTLRRQVLYLDAKGDPDAAVKFVATMRAAGVPFSRLRVFPSAPYNGWRGDSAALLNRLLATQTFSDEYYLFLCKLVLGLALRGGSTVRESETLLRRLDKEALKSLYALRPEEVRIDAMSAHEVAGVWYRYAGFFQSLAGQLDGTWSFDDVDAAYILIPGLSLPFEAAPLGRFFLEELAHYIGERKPPEQEVFVIFDEVSALNTVLDSNPANLFERLRSFGAGIAGTSQSVEGLGRYAERVIEAATLRIVHRSGDPERMIRRAGTKKQVETGWQVREDAVTGSGTMRLGETFNVHPDEVRRLPAGVSFFIAAGRGCEVCVRAVPVTAEAREEARLFLASGS